MPIALALALVATIGGAVASYSYDDDAPLGTRLAYGATTGFLALGFAGFIGLFAFNKILNVDATDCRHLDKYSYGLVDVDATAGTATVSSRDSAGAVIADQSVPSTFCSQVYGP